MQVYKYIPLYSIYKYIPFVHLEPRIISLCFINYPMRTYIYIYVHVISYTRFAIQICILVASNNFIGFVSVPKNTDIAHFEKQPPLMNNIFIYYYYICRGIMVIHKKKK